MTVITRSQASNITWVAGRVAFLRDTTAKDDSANMYVYKDDKSGIEYITEEHIQMRCLSNDFYTKKKLMVVGLDLYYKISEIHPDYLKSCPEHVVNRKDLFALAPIGYLWEEKDSGTSYYHFDEWKILKQYAYKRGGKFNIVYDSD